MEEFKLYGGKVTLQFDPVKHRYYATEEDGVTLQIPSITTILGVIDKPQLVQWAVNCAVDHVRSAFTEEREYSADDIDQILDEAKYAHKMVKDKAASIGTQAHNWLERYWQARMDGSDYVPETPEDTNVANCVTAGLKWIEAHDITPILIEKPLYSRNFRVAGRLDKLAKVDGRLAVVDWKSSTGLWPSYILQTAAYAKIYEEETGEPVQDRWLVKLGKYDGEFEAKKFSWAECESDWTAFQGAIALHNRLRMLNRKGD